MFGFRNLIRKPGWENDVILKLETIKNLMIERGCTILLFSGDMLDRSKSKEWSFKLYLKVLEVLTKIFVENGINIYSIQGNHDMLDGNESVEGSVFGKLVEDGIIHHITTNPLVLNLQDEATGKRVDVSIQGLDYTEVKENIQSGMERINSSTLNTEMINCMMTHTNITPNETQVSDFTYKHLSETYPNIDIHFCGHYHLGFEPDKVNNTTFINPWNLTRVIRDYNSRMELHTPEVTFINFIKYSKDAEPEEFTEVIQLPHKSFSEAFREEVINLLEESDNGFKFFKEGVVDLEELLQNQEMTDEEMISVLITKTLEGVPDERKSLIKNKVLQYLGEENV